MQVNGPGSRGSLSLNQSTTTPRTSARTDFGAQMRNGIAAGGGAASQAIGVAAPFVPGAAVVSAAVSGAAGSVGGGGSGGFASGGSGGLAGAQSVGADGIPIGGSALNSSGGATGSAASGGSSQQDLLNQTKGMQEMAQSFNLQYLQLQEKMQAENRSFSTVSNVMKTKHDTAKSSISNVR
jgi:hypothetical protein